MEDKHSFPVKEVLILVGFVLALAGIVAWVTVPAFRGDVIEFYIRLFLFMFAVLLLAVLRLYNAVVANTRYNIALVKVITALHKMMPGLTSMVQKQTLSVQSNTARAKALSETIESAREVLDEIVKKTKK